MAIRTVTRPGTSASLPPTGYSDDTAPRIRAYLASVIPLRNTHVALDEDYQRGRALIERMALAAHGEDAPSLKLSVRDCADVLMFVRDSEPLDASTWFDEPKDLPHHLCGLQFILGAVIDNLHGAIGAQDEARP